MKYRVTIQNARTNRPFQAFYESLQICKEWVTGMAIQEKLPPSAAASVYLQTEILVAKGWRLAADKDFEWDSTPPREKLLEAQLKYLSGRMGMVITLSKDPHVKALALDSMAALANITE